MPGKPPPGECPTCRKAVAGDGPYRPFCSDRCRLLDLGRWLRGDYVLGRPLRPGEVPEEE